MSSRRLKNRYGDEIVLETEKIEQFKMLLRGALVQPDDDDYDEGRKVYNAMHDRRPALLISA